jgi:hypothetical protein
MHAGIQRTFRLLHAFYLGGTVQSFDAVLKISYLPDLGGGSGGGRTPSARRSGFYDRQKKGNRDDTDEYRQTLFLNHFQPPLNHSLTLRWYEAPVPLFQVTLPESLLSFQDSEYLGVTFWEKSIQDLDPG